MQSFGLDAFVIISEIGFHISVKQSTFKRNAVTEPYNVQEKCTQEIIIIIINLKRSRKYLCFLSAQSFFWKAIILKNQVTLWYI